MIFISFYQLSLYSHNVILLIVDLTLSILFYPCKFLTYFGYCHPGFCCLELFMSSRKIMFLQKDFCFYVYCCKELFDMDLDQEFLSLHLIFLKLAHLLFWDSIYSLFQEQLKFHFILAPLQLQNLAFIFTYPHLDLIHPHYY